MGLLDPGGSVTLEELGVVPEVIAAYWPHGFRVDEQAALAALKAAESETLPCFALSRKLILSTFDLRCAASGPGREAARTDFWIHPVEALEAQGTENFEWASAFLKQRVFPLGVVQHNEVGLGLAEDGSVFMVYEGETRRLADSLGRAINALALGWRMVDAEWSRSRAPAIS